MSTSFRLHTDDNMRYASSLIAALKRGMKHRFISRPTGESRPWSMARLRREALFLPLPFRSKPPVPPNLSLHSPSIDDYYYCHLT